MLSFNLNTRYKYLLTLNNSFRITEQQDEFLKQAVIEQRTYEQIAQNLHVPRSTLSIWWEELKTEREALAILGDI